MTTKRNPNSYSIWMIPTGKKFFMFEKIIFDLSQSFNGIQFIPHVTLISGLNNSEKILSKKIAKIAKKIMPFNIQLVDIQFLNEFFQSFFIKVKIDSQLRILRKIAQKEFPNTEKYFNPHLSLAYGNRNIKFKKRLRKTIQNPVKNFMVKELYLAHNDEINYKWKVVNKFPIIK